MTDLLLIARVKAGRFEAWFDKVNERHFEITVYEAGHEYAKPFSTKAEAQVFWHELTSAKGFQHCYCC